MSETTHAAPAEATCLDCQATFVLDPFDTASDVRCNACEGARLIEEVRNHREPPPPPIPVRERYYLTECAGCGWVGSSEQCHGDDESVVCPVCYSCDCEESPSEKDTAKHGEAVMQRILAAEARAAEADAADAALKALEPVALALDRWERSGSLVRIAIEQANALQAFRVVLAARAALTVPAAPASPAHQDAASMRQLAQDSGRSLRIVSERLAAAEEECEALRDTARQQTEELRTAWETVEEGRAELARLTDPEMKDLYLSNGGINLAVAGPIVERLALAMAGWMRAQDAPNYVEMHLNDRDDPLERYTVTVQRLTGRSPHQLRTDAEAETKRIRAELRDFADRQPHTWIETVQVLRGLTTDRASLVAEPQRSPIRRLVGRPDCPRCQGRGVEESASGCNRWRCECAVPAETAHAPA